MKGFGDVLGCHRRDYSRERFCVGKTVDRLKSALRLEADADLLSITNVNERLRQAQRPLPSDAPAPRYTLVPAAAGGGGHGNQSLAKTPMGASAVQTFFFDDSWYATSYLRAVGRDKTLSLNASERATLAHEWLQSDKHPRNPRWNPRGERIHLGVQIADIPLWISTSFRKQDYVVVTSVRCAGR